MTKKELEQEVEMLRTRVAVLEAVTRGYWWIPLDSEKDSYQGYGPFYKVTW